MRYFKRYWDEPRAEPHQAWGCSWWYFEVDASGSVTRQIEIYDRGPTLRYDRQRLGDEFGKLSEAPLDLAEFAAFEISSHQFESAWGAGGGDT